MSILGLLAIRALDVAAGQREADPASTSHADDGCSACAGAAPAEPDDDSGS